MEKRKTWITSISQLFLVKMHYISERNLILNLILISFSQLKKKFKESLLWVREKDVIDIKSACRKCSHRSHRIWLWHSLQVNHMHFKVWEALKKLFQLTQVFYCIIFCNQKQIKNSSQKYITPYKYQITGKTVESAKSPQSFWPWSMETVSSRANCVFCNY